MQEILTYEIFIKNKYTYICIPGCGLINPKYQIKENNLFIILNNYAKTFIIKNLNNNFINSIKDGKAFLVERLDLDNQIEHPITLII